MLSYTALFRKFSSTLKGYHSGAFLAVAVWGGQRGKPSQNYGVSFATWDHTMLLATRHKRTHSHSALIPPSKAGTRFTHPGGMEG